MQTKRFIISGRVQGVGFRWFAMRSAETAGVRGYVRNLVDGRVESVAQGSAEQVDSYRSAISRGPATAVVANIDETDMTSDRPFDRFEIRH